MECRHGKGAEIKPEEREKGGRRLAKKTELSALVAKKEMDWGSGCTSEK